MPKILSSLSRSFRTTPFFGRTLAVLSFFFLFVKQIVLLFSYGRLFQWVSSSEIFAHYLGYFVSDFIVCLIVLGLVAMNVLIKKTLFKIINNIIILGIFLLFVLDIFTMYFFQSRISILDIKQFINPSLGDFSWLMVSIIVVLCIISIVSFLIVQRPKFKKRQNFLLGIYFLLFALWCIGVGMYAPGGFKSIPDNIISLNLSAIRGQFSEITEGNIPDIYQKFFSKKRGLDNHPNVVVVFAESLSPIDSLRLGKVNDNLPYFDRIQKDGITFTNFINNGCTSDTAHIGFLLWVEPIKIFWYSIWAYSWFKNFTQSLPNFFGSQWYKPIFISAVDVDFLGQKEFLSGVGFTQIIGKEAFEKEKKYVFDAAADHSLYNKTLQTIQEQTGAYFIVLQSISFHKPYNTPYGKTEASALRYADKSLYYFYLQLKKSWFFDNGILAIVTDHRKMEAIEKGEKEALGEFWYTKWVATIVGTGIAPGSINTNIIQHTDLFYSFKQFFSKGLVTVSKIFNDAFSANKKRDRGIVYCRYFQKNNKYTIVEPDGKWTTFNELSEIKTSHSFVHKYIMSYISFQQGSWSTKKDGSDMIVIAHQWSPRQAPENSLEWFQLAKKNWANGIELDVSFTKDKQNLVIHGDRMRATTCGKNYIVKNYDLAYLKEHCPLKNGEQLRTLEEILRSIDGMFDYYFVDVKVYTTKEAEDQVTNVIETVKKLWMQDRVIISSYDQTANYILWSQKNIIAAWDTFDIGDISSLHNVNHQYFMTPYTNITWSMAQEMEDIGKKLVTYTVNTTGDLQQLYKQWIRMVMTDDVPLIKWWAEKNLGQ